MLHSLRQNKQHFVESSWKIIMSYKFLYNNIGRGKKQVIVRKKGFSFSSFKVAWADSSLSKIGQNHAGKVDKEGKPFLLPSKSDLQELLLWKQKSGQWSGMQAEADRMTPSRYFFGPSEVKNSACPQCSTFSKAKLSSLICAYIL